MKSPLAILASICLFLLIVFALSMLAKKQVPPQAVSAPDVIWHQAQQDTVASDTVLSQAGMPALKIGEKEDPDVYLQSLDIQVEVTGNIASTRYTMVFKNKTNRILEGELTFPLPDGRTVTHYALDVNGRMREAVPVEKARATQVFEEIQQRRVVVDPGILERVEGNNFRTRIYPFPARGTRTISIGYEEELPLERGLLYYRLPMAYQSPLEKFSLKAIAWNSGQKPLVPKAENEIRFDKAGENYVASLYRTNYSPSRALIFALPTPYEIPQSMAQPAQGSYYFMASVAPIIGEREKQWSKELAIIWDVSLSGSQRKLKKEMEILDTIFAKNKEANVHLYYLNNKLKEIGEYKSLDSLKKTLAAAIFDGGTDFSQINLDDIKGNEILFFSDGISTLSDADFIKDGKANRPVHCVVSSSKADYSSMKLIASRTKGKFVNINALSAEQLRNELLNETLQYLGTEHGNNVREVYPSIATPVQGNFSVAGISSSKDAELTLLFGFGNNVEKRIKVQLDAKNAASQGNIYRIWAQKKISELDLNYEKNRSELLELGQQFGIVTRNSSLIVLETIDDYVRYAIEPPASEPTLLAEYQRRASKSGGQLKFLAASNVANLKAADGNRVQADNRRTEKVRLEGRRGSATGGFNDGYAEGGSGGIGDMLGGLMGGSAGGIGTKAKSSLKAPSARDIDMGSDPSRSKAEILAVVNARMPGLRNIYNKYLKLKNGFGGKVILRFTIAPYGDIVAISIVSSTTGYGDFDDAVKNMVATWKWKVIKSGKTTLAIPFNFDEGGSQPIREEAPPPIPQVVTRPREIVWEVSYGDNMLNNAANATQVIKNWWNIDFKPPQINLQPNQQFNKYPMPDANQGSSYRNPYASQLTGNTEADYQIYLMRRKDNANKPTFYFEMANWFYTHNDKETALRILTSIAELEIENASLYRLLGYKFKEYGEFTLQKFVCQKVIQWRPMEPHSYRDYALALADNGEAQAALDSLYEMLKKPYSENIKRRSRGIEESVVVEINHLIAKNPQLNTSKIDKRLLMNTPVDIRVVMNWNKNNTDIDLYVLDPNNEECYYSHNKTKIGGRLSRTSQAGYGPEQFMLKKAMKGKYKVYAGYYSSREFAADGPSTVMAEIYIKYADKTEQRKVVNLQLSNVEGKLEVAEFEF